MTPQAAVEPRWRLWLRAAATVAAWIVVMAGIHRLTIAYHAELTGVLNSPARQIAATALLLTALAYLVVLTLPAVPHLALRSLGIVAVWALLLALALYVSRIGRGEAQAMLVALRGDAGGPALGLLALAYAVALAMPFVPGMELGLLMMVAFGTVGVLVVYTATIIGLTMAYMVGRLLPARFMRAYLKDVDSALPGQDMASAMPALIATSRLGRSAAQVAGAAVRPPLPCAGSVPEPARQCGGWRRWRGRAAVRHERPVRVAGLPADDCHRDIAGAHPHADRSAQPGPYGRVERPLACGVDLARAPVRARPVGASYVAGHE
jgi:hypothetical protein